MEKYIIALDQGTTSCRCILFNKQGPECFCFATHLLPKQNKEGSIHKTHKSEWRNKWKSDTGN